MKSLLTAAGVVCMTSAVVLAAEPPPSPAVSPRDAAMEAKPVKQLSDVKYGPGPDALPPGSQLAVMAGDPASKGFVSLRAKMPAGYKVPPHWHPTDEHVTVLSGTFLLGMGDTMDPKSAQQLKAGGYINAMANAHHYAIAKTPVVIQIDMMGPFEITYINPADDPRNKKPK